MILIDKETIAASCEMTGTCELYENYQFGPSMDQVCVAIKASGMREVIQFFIQLASRQPSLATDMADASRVDHLGYDTICYFPGYDLEEEPAD